jgi:acyl carrier protein
MNRSDVEKKIVTMLSEKLGFDESEIKLQSSLYDDLGMDSLDCIETVVELEEIYELGTEIPDEETEKAKTVKDIVDYICKVTKTEK